MATAGDVWQMEAEIVPADTEVSSVSTQTSPAAFLHRVGADTASILKTDKDRATVDHWKHEIVNGRAFNVTLSLDVMGNVIGADGRHRALAALQSGHERIHVVVTRNLR